MRKDILNKYFPILKSHYPDCKEEEITIFDDGHDHYVLVVNNVHAFRFPRTDAHGKQDHVINAFSQKFAPVSPVPIQKMTGHVDSETGIKYQTYAFIPGVHLSREMASTLSEKELEGIAKDLGGFLSTLHSFPVDEARQMDMEALKGAQDYGEYFKHFLEKDRKAFFSLLSIKEQEWIEQSVQDFYDLTRDHPFELTVTHSDMLPEHIIIDSDKHTLGGVIDFSPRIADPAYDFKFFDRYGEAFLKTVYENYPSVGEYFDDRRRFYAGNLPVANLYQSIERNDKSMVALRLKQLKEYITAQLDNNTRGDQNKI